MDTLRRYWASLQHREQMVLLIGGVLVLLILFYAMLWSPSKKAIHNYQKILPPKRVDLVWMRQHTSGEQTEASSQQKAESATQSLLSVLESTAKRAGLRKAIQQMSPGETNQQVKVFLGEVDFNNWIRWTDVLYRQHRVQPVQLSVQKDPERNNIAEVRVTYQRSG